MRVHAPDSRAAVGLHRRAVSILGGALISGGASLLGGFLGAEEGEDNRHLQEQMHLQNMALQREFAQNGIRWRVDDAKAAGLHPLYALTGQTAQATPSTLNFDNSNALGRGLADAGQHIGRAVAAQATPHERDMQQAQLEGLKQRTATDAAQAAYYAALAKKASQEAPLSAGIDTNVVTQAYHRPNVEAHPLYRDAVKLEPDAMTSRHITQDGQTAGQDHPGMRQFEFPGGFKAMLPATGGGGIPEEIDVTMVPLLLGANIQKYGWRWVVDLVNYTTGASPSETRAQDARWKAKLRSMFKLPKASDFGLPMRGATK